MSFNQVCQRKQANLVVRRAEEMNNSWKTLGKNTIKADLLKDLILNVVMHNEFVDNLGYFATGLTF